MADQQKHQELIEAYLSNALDQEARRAFEAKLQADPQLAEELQLHKEMAEALEDEATFSLESTLLEIREEMEEEEEAAPKTTGKVVPLHKRYRLLSIAAAVLILVGFFYVVQTGDSNRDLYTDYFEDYPNYITARSGAVSEEEAILNSSIQQYSEEEFEAALIGFQQLLSANPEQYDILFYAGMCQIQLEQLAAAKTTFQRVIQQGDNNYVDPAQWYLALAQLRSDDIDGAKSTLTTIIKNKGPLWEKATSLQSDLQ